MHEECFGNRFLLGKARFDERKHKNTKTSLVQKPYPIIELLELFKIKHDSICHMFPAVVLKPYISVKCNRSERKMVKEYLCYNLKQPGYFQVCIL